MKQLNVFLGELMGVEFTQITYDVDCRGIWLHVNMGLVEAMGFKTMGEICSLCGGVEFGGVVPMVGKGVIEVNGRRIKTKRLVEAYGLIDKQIKELYGKSIQEGNFIAKRSFKEVE